MQGSDGGRVSPSLSGVSGAGARGLVFRYMASVLSLLLTYSENSGLDQAASGASETTWGCRGLPRDQKLECPQATIWQCLL